MTISEAKNKVCPFMAQMGEDASGYTVFSKHINCITSNCMAWEFDYSEERTEGAIPITSRKYSECAGYCKRLKEA